jgi:hypothetical protein
MARPPEAVFVQLDDWDVLFPAQYTHQDIIKYWGMHEFVLDRLRASAPRKPSLEIAVEQNYEQFKLDEQRCWCWWLLPGPKY